MPWLYARLAREMESFERVRSPVLLIFREDFAFTFAHEGEKFPRRETFASNKSTGVPDRAKDLEELARAEIWWKHYNCCNNVA